MDKSQLIENRRNDDPYRGSISNRTLGELIHLQASRYPDHLAVIDYLHDRRLTYQELDTVSDDLAKGLIHLGLRQGDHVAVIIDNCWEHVVTKLAISKAGGVLVNVNIHEKADMLRRLLENTECSIMIIKQRMKNRDHMEMLYEICPELKMQTAGRLQTSLLPKLRHIIVTGGTGAEGCAWQLNEILKAGEQCSDQLLENRAKQLEMDQIATIIHTSGSSGTPKGVPLTHRQMMLNALEHVHYMKMTADDRLCVTAPLFHSLGCIGSMLTTLMAGATMVLFDDLKHEGVLELLVNEKCTVMSCVPTILLRLMHHAEEIGGEQNLHLRLCVIAGASCPEDVFRHASEVLHIDHFMVMYGMTEAGPGISSTELQDPLRMVSTTVGRFWPMVEWKIRDLATGITLGENQVGEICIKGPCVTAGYIRNIEETEKAFEDGWLRTGDIATVDRDGIIRLKGRCKDIIIRGGENISPKEIEDFLRQHPKIEDACVVGAPNREFGESVYAFLILKPEQELRLEELRSDCKGKISTIKIPEEIEILQQFPLTGSGKIAKEELKKIAAEHTRFS